jgi:HAD superfamily hydrolase (TIGR01509 family)
MSLHHDAIIFDFDGVIVDSEWIANEVLAQVLTENGMPTTVEDSFEQYMGRAWADNVAAIEARWGKPEVDLRARIKAIGRARMDAELRLIPGVQDFVGSLGATPRAIASSSQLEWITSRLAQFDFAAAFGEHVFSAAVHVTRGKPHPDIYLHAARALGADPARVVVVEDSPTGVKAGVAAGMTVIGLCAGSHIRPGHHDQLIAAGANRVADSYQELSGFLGRAIG